MTGEMGGRVYLKGWDAEERAAWDRECERRKTVMGESVTVPADELAELRRKAAAWDQLDGLRRGVGWIERWGAADVAIVRAAVEYAWELAAVMIEDGPTTPA